jgi:hypothetical protein
LGRYRYFRYLSGRSFSRFIKGKLGKESQPNKPGTFLGVKKTQNNYAMKKKILASLLFFMTVAAVANAQYVKVRIGFPVGVSVTASGRAPYAGAVWDRPGMAMAWRTLCTCDLVIGPGPKTWNNMVSRSLEIRGKGYRWVRGIGNNPWFLKGKRYNSS